MPTLKKQKQKNKNKKKFNPANSNGFLPIISSKASRESSLSKKSRLITPMHTPLNRSIDIPNVRYALRTRNSLSPISSNSTSKYNYMTEIDSINKLIKELDGNIPKKHIRLVKKHYHNCIKEIIIIQKF